MTLKTENHKTRNTLIAIAIILFAVAMALTPMIDFSNFSPRDYFGFGQGRGNGTGDGSGIKRTAQPGLMEPLDQTLLDQIGKTLNYIYKNIDPETHLAYSLPGDVRLHYWSVVYDNTMRCIAHIRTGDLAMAKHAIDYFMENTAIQKVGYIQRNGKLVGRPGWVINIIDAGEARASGRGIEHIVHVGPNAYLGIASLHLFIATGERKYLEYARSRWLLIRDLQNEDPNDPNYGGVRMGPLGDPNNPLEQKLEFKQNNPSFYYFYNGEHAADYKALSDLLARIDRVNRKEYRHASDLIAIWDKKIYDPEHKLFFIGTTEKRFFDVNYGLWMNKGVMRIHPLDTSALKICAYGVSGLEQFEKDGAQKIRLAIERHFKVTVKSRIAGEDRAITGYDFIADFDRPKVVLFEEEGPMGDVKVKKGMGRKPLLSDEWSTWVAFSDLRMAKDFRDLHDQQKSQRYLAAYKANARIEALRTGDPLDDRTIAYPYSHPIRAGFNKPVGFGWNTHHEPYSIIGGVARILGFMGADPFSLDDEMLTVKINPKDYRLASWAKNPRLGLVTEAELYVNEAWIYVRVAQRRDFLEEENWVKAAATVERMLIDHPDWGVMAEKQNRIAKNSKEQFPLMGMGGLSLHDLEPVYRKYWALYHVGTGEFIRVMAYTELARMAQLKKNFQIQAAYKEKADAAADRIMKKFYFSQAFDRTGWLWQPIFSLREYVDNYDEKIAKL